MTGLQGHTQAAQQDHSMVTRSDTTWSPSAATRLSTNGDKGSASIQNVSQENALGTSATTQKPVKLDSEQDSAKLSSSEREAAVSAQVCTNSEVLHDANEQFDNSASSEAALKSATELETHISSASGFDWLEIFQELPCQGLLRSIAAHCQFLKQQDQHIFLRLDETQAALYNEKLGTELEHLLSKHLGKALKLHIDIGSLSAESPHLFTQRKQHETHMKQVERFSQHPAINKIMNHFSAQLDEKSVNLKSS